MKYFQTKFDKSFKFDTDMPNEQTKKKVMS